MAGSLLSFGSESVFEFSRQARVISGKLIDLKKSEMLWGGGGGRFTPLMAEAAAEFVKGKIASEGEGLPGRGGHATHPITKRWKATKEKYAKASELPIGAHYASGSLYRNTKVLSRRYSGGSRYATVGVSQRVKVPHFGYGGISSSRMIPISEYIHNIEIGANHPRPLVIMAIIAFAEKVWPTGKRTLHKARDSFLRNNFSAKALKEISPTGNVQASVDKATKEMIQTLVSECGFSRTAAIKMAEAVKR